MNKRFNEQFFGYHYNAEGFHSGPSEPITDETGLLQFIQLHHMASEIRFTDTSDRLIMHLIGGVLVWPKREDGQNLRWDATVGNFRIMNPMQVLAAKPILEGDPDASTQSKLVCIRCKAPFSNANVHTPEGWAETRITRMCEDCFDAITTEPGRDDDVSGTEKERGEYRLMMRMETGEEVAVDCDHFPSEQQAWDHHDTACLSDMHPECTFFVEKV